MKGKKLDSRSNRYSWFMDFPRHRPEFVRLGDQNLASNDDKLEPVDYDIKRFIMHDNYDYFKRTNDVAVIELVKQVMFTINIRPACLSQEVNFKGRVVAVRLKSDRK